jgi:phosphatidylglycerol---prolipoprotein diacylglyceryl transferase
VHTLVLQSPGAVLFYLGPLAVRWYGVMIALGFLAACHFATRLAKRQGIDADKITNITLICFLAGIIGSRLYYVALNWTTYLSRPLDILATWQGGMSIHGGIIAGFVAFYLSCKYYKLPPRQIADICGAVLPLGQAIGRFGNFFNSEAYGIPVPAGFPLAVFIPVENRVHRFADASLFHATFLYESIWNLAIFILIYFFLSRKLSGFPGTCGLVYIGLYAVGRLAIEPLRTDSIMAGSIPVAMLASIAMLLVCLALLPVFLKPAAGKP